MPDLSELLSKAKKPAPDNPPQGTATAPQGTATAPQGTATAPQGTATAPQGTATAPQGTATAPQGTATAPQGTATAPQGTVTASQSADNAQGAVAGMGQVIASGAEGTLYLQPDNRALKVYNPGFHYNAKVLPLVKKLNGRGSLVDVYDFGTGTFQGQAREFELMQYCPLGPASSRKDLKGNATAIKSIAVSVALALDDCHKAGFIHKDVKPANILIENEKSWHCLLCDFGIADLVQDATKQTLQNRTPIYAAPEMYDPNNCVVKEGRTYCRLTPAADYYSLGMTILSLWLGESAFAAQETELAFQKKDGNIKVPTDMPEPLHTIVQGLLIPDPDDRWGLKEIKDKLAGKNVEIKKRMKIVYSSEKNQVAHSIEELAAFMTQDPKLATRYIYTDILTDWLKPMPELQASIKEIIKDTANNRELGYLKVIHTLNPLYDLNLNCKTDDPEWAMNDQRIGELLNKVYYLYFTKYGSDYNAMTQGWDADDAKLVHSPLVAYQIAKSFESEGDLNYVGWFLTVKGKRFAEQLDYFGKRLKQSDKDKKKAGPKDRDFLVQVGMMKTIVGFNAKPAYRLDRTDTILRSLDDFHSAPSKNLKDALVNDKGIRGWLAVMHQENPRANLSQKYRYESLLEQYVQDLGHCDSNDRAYRRYKTAQDEAKDIASTAKARIRRVYTASTIQKLLTSLLALLPAVLLFVSIVLNALDNPVLDVNAIENKWVYYGLGIVFAAVSYFLFFDGDGGCLLSIIIGAAASAIIVLLLKFLGQYLLWIYAAIVLAVIVLFSLMTLLKRSRNVMKAKSVMKPGFEELTLEPLYYAFSNETAFDSSMNQYNDQATLDRWKRDVNDRWKTVIIYVLAVWALIACSALLPKSSRMSSFNRQMRHSASTLFTNDTIPLEEEELQPETTGDGTTTPFVKPKKRGIIRE